MEPQEIRNRLTASMFRMIHLIRLLDYEYRMFDKSPVSSGLKNVLRRAKQNYASCIEQIKSYLPNSKDKIDFEMKHSEEKVHAIGNIIEKLFLLEEEDVLKLEQEFDEQVKIVYTGENQEA